MGFAVSRGKKVAFALIFLALTVAGIAVAGGQKEDPIATARDLIIRKRLNDAILLLTDTVRKHPDRIDEAESLMQTIRNIRGEYFTLWQELIKVIKTEPDKPEKALAIIEQMKKLDAAPNERTKRNLTEWQAIVQFRYNLNKFDEVMASGDAFIKAGKYAEAIRAYLSGFDIFRAEFLAEGYSQQLVVGRAETATTRITDTVQQFIASMSGIEQAARSFEAAAANGDPKLLTSRLDELTKRIVQVLTLRNGLESAANSLDSINAQAHLEKPQVEQNWYLTFITWYIRGRPQVSFREGILAAIAGFLDSSQTGADKAIIARASSEYQSSIDQYDSGSLAEAEKKFVSTIPVARVAFSTVELWTRRLTVNSDLTLPAADQDMLRKHLPEFLTAQYLYESSESYRTLIGLIQGGQGVDVLSGKTLVDLVANRNKLDGFLSELEKNMNIWKQRVGTLKDSSGTYDNQSALRIAEQTYADYQTAAGRLQQTDATGVEKIAELQMTNLKTSYAQAQSAVASADKNLKGVQQTVVSQGSEATVTYRYPEKALATLNDAVAGLTTLESDVKSYLDQYSNAPVYISELPRIKSSIDVAKSLDQETATLLDQAKTNAATARKNVELAANLRTRADRALQEAQVALTRRDVETAIQKLQDARQVSLQALDLQHDQNYSDTMDRRLADLGDQIKRANYVRVVTDVRNLIEQGRSEYQQDQFAQAEADLLKAKNLWSAVSPNTPQLEIENWLKIVQAALNLQNTRELTETDPLFFTLGNYLNRAKENFTEGKQLYTSGNTQEGKVFLAKAEANIQSVVVARPFNQEARVLALRILQITNPKQFPEIFKQRFDEAVSRSKTNARSALVDLYDLRAIDANFPGLQNEIARLEIDLGIRPNPVTIAKKQESDTLVADAQKLAATGDRTQTQVAVVRLEKALEMNPDNRNAQVLLDRYRIALGSPATYTLPGATMQEFSQAQNLFIGGRLADALAIVDRIWQNPANRGYSPLVDLRNNILSRLGQ